MNLKFYPLRALLFSLLLFGFKARTQAQAALDFYKTVENISTGGDGTTASSGQILRYTIYIRNLTTANYVAARLYDNVPQGVSYNLGSTTLNGTPVADKSGPIMPYSSNGAYINSPTYGQGILAPNSQAIIRFTVTVTANGGSVFNNATIEATQGSVATVQATNTVYTAINVEAGCNIVYQTTTLYPDPSDGTTTQREWSFLRELNTSNGTGGAVLYNGTSGVRREAVPPTSTVNISAQLMDNCAAIAYDRPGKKIYFVNNFANPAQDLMFVDMNTSPYIARRFTGKSLQPANGDNGYRINRMGMGSDGFCYALTSNGRDLVKFSVNHATNLATITRLGALSDAASNGNKKILDEEGGDLFADGSGKLYLIANSSNMYKINPTNRVATYMGKVNPFPGTSQSLAIDALGQVFIGGQYTDVYKLNLQTMAATKINSNSTNVYVSGDYTTCGFPVLASSIIADKTYRNIDGTSNINGGDTIEYTITVTNIGNINAAGVYMYDYIPPATIYLPGTTKMNNIGVADVGGVMPFAVSGGRLVNSPGEDPGIIRPTAASRAVVTFRVRTEPNKQVCNQSRISLLDGDGNVMFVNSNDPTNIGQTPTCFYSDGVLPLANLKFKGSLLDDKSVLTWTMNGDDNVSYYEVEFSESGASFSTAGKIEGKGQTNSANTYTYTDVAHTFSSVRYYRLKAVQKGGNYTYSGIIKLNLKDLDITALPNPFDKDINVQIRIKTAETVRIRLIDFYGREVYTTTEQLSIGSHSLSIRIPAGLAKGMYVLDVRTGSEQIFQKKLLKK